LATLKHTRRPVKSPEGAERPMEWVLVCIEPESENDTHSPIWVCHERKCDQNFNQNSHFFSQNKPYNSLPKKSHTNPQNRVWDAPQITTFWAKMTGWIQF
jgi:hypothetical protein